jgi:DHA2 family multidrug resistance protein
MEYINGLSALGGPATRGWSIIDAIVTRQAFTLGVNDVFLLCTVVFLAMIPVVWFARPPFGNVAAGAGH